MQECSNCGKKFDVANARDEYEAEEEFGGEFQYDDEYPEHELCGACAISLDLENLGAGRRMDFSLTTGKPPEDMPDDWQFNGDY